MPVLSGASGVEIASGLAAILDMEYVALESRRFPDGEAYVRESGRVKHTMLVLVFSLLFRTMDTLGRTRDSVLESQFLPN